MQPPHLYLEVIAVGAVAPLALYVTVESLPTGHVGTEARTLAREKVERLTTHLGSDVRNEQALVSLRLKKIIDAEVC